MDTPKFSILIPVYNGEKTVARAIDSALGQTCGDFELLICDDGSTDGTWEILERYAQDDPRIKLLKHEANRGGICARNTLIRNASAPHSLCLDADDRMDPEVLRIASETLAREDWDIIHFRSRNVHSDGTCENPPWFPARFRSNCILESHFDGINEFWNLWGKVIRTPVLKSCCPPDVRAMVDDVFFAIPLYYSTKSYCALDTPPMWDYYVGIGYWSGMARSEMSLRKYREFCQLRREMFQYNYDFIVAKNVKITRETLLRKCDVGHAFGLILKFKLPEEREEALAIFSQYFGVTVVPMPYMARFYPPGCEPKRYTYSLKSI